MIICQVSRKHLTDDRSPIADKNRYESATKN
jgi:hypothetical protein